jgi:hypothetical protein
LTGSQTADTETADTETADTEAASYLRGLLEATP